MDKIKRYIRNNRISADREQQVISYIETHIRITAFGQPDWYHFPDAFYMEKVSENDLMGTLDLMLKNLNSSMERPYFIIQMDNATPPLKSRLDDWVEYHKDILYCDTIFLSADGQHFIHYDFYGNLWGKAIFLV